MTQRLSVLAVVGALMLAAGGCGVLPSSGDDEEGRIASLPAAEPGAVEEVSLGQSGYLDVPIGMEVRDFENSEADLRGPHYVLGISWVAIGRAVEQTTLPLVSGLTERRAADGEELVLVAVSGESTNGQWKLGERAKPTAELVVDGQARSLSTVPLPNQEGMVSVPLEGTLVVASVPQGASVELRVTDEEKTQTVDLRAGEREGDAIDGYYRPTAQEVSYSEDISLVAMAAGRPYPMTLTVAESTIGEIAIKNAMLCPWTPSNGWASEGRAWLIVPHPVLSTPYEVATPGLVLEIDERSVFGVRLPDGTVVEETGGTRQVKTLIGPPAGPELVFDVPAGFTTGTFTMDIAAMSASAEFSDGTDPIGWQTPPTPFEMPLDLAR
jgi:hypothetical protein